MPALSTKQVKALALDPTVNTFEKKHGAKLVGKSAGARIGVSDETAAAAMPEVKEYMGWRVRRNRRRGLRRRGEGRCP